jgi:hypothetical protein
MKYDAKGASITLDGDASDWADAEFKSQIPFEKGGELVLFEEYGGGTWSGPADHSSAVAFAWDASNLYIGVVVTDDTHQNGGSGWNGDSIQMVFANAAQDTVTHLYNYGLSDDGDVVIHNEKGDGGTEASITRDEDTTTTLYEFSFPAASLGLDGYESGMQIGVGLCVNDGDTQDGQGGHKGWSGWGPYSAVYGKTASATGLVSLVGEATGVDSLDPLFTSEPVTSAYEEIDYSYYITTDVDPLDAPVLSGTSLPVWLKLTDNGDGTGTLSGTPQSGDLGGHSILLEALQAVRVTHIYSNGNGQEGAFAAVKNDGSVVTWGSSDHGGDSSTVAGDLSAGVKQIYSSDKAFAAIKDDGSVVTWGSSDHGGDSSAVADDLSSGVTQIYSAHHINLKGAVAFAAVKEDGSVVTWGNSDHGGDSSGVADDLSSGVTKIYSTVYAFAALKEDGSVVTWGNSGSGDSSGVADDLSSGVTEIYSSTYAFAALKDDGSVVTWGSSDYGGDSSAVALSSGVTQVQPNRYAFAAVKKDGSVVTWGSSDHGGDSSAVADDLSLGVTKIYSTAYAFAALKEDGSVVTWGSPDNGADSSAVAGDLSSGVTQIYSNHAAFAALKEDGSVVTWGAWVSLLGYDLGSGVIQIYSTFYAFAALKDDGSVVTWGMNGGGGNSYAVSDDLSSEVTEIYSSTYAFAALKDDGSVVTWGNSGFGGDSSAVSDDLNPSMLVLDSQEFVITVDPFGDPVTYTNIATTLIGQVTIDGTAARDGDVVAIYVGEELRGKQAVNIDVNGDYSAAGTAWLNAQVHAAGGEEVAVIRVYEASTGITHDKVGLSVEIKPDGEAGTFAEPLLIQMDNVAPELTLLGEAQVTIDQRTTYVDAGASATDNVDGDLTTQIVVSGEVDTSSPGTYTLKYDVSDAAGNAAESVSRTVVVEKTTVVQTLDLKKGWNLISFYVESEDMTPATVLGSIKDKLVQIKNLKNSYNPTLPAFINTLNGLNVEDGYWVKVSEATIFELEGVVPEGASIAVRPGWNLVGYPRESGAAPANELTSLGNTVLQFKNLKDSYNPALPAFINTLKVITPGLGYWLKASGKGVWNVGDVSGEGGNRDIVKVTSLDESRWGQVVVYPNVSATVLAQVTVEGKAVSRGSVVVAFLGDELRGMQEVVLADGKSYVAINVNLPEAEKVSFRIWDTGSDKEYGVTKTMSLQMGETYGTAEKLVKLDGVASGSGRTIRIVGYERDPFGFGFESQMGSSYVVEATGDLKEWGVIKTYNGTGTMIQFEDERDQVFPQVYYRVRVVE